MCHSPSHFIAYFVVSNGCAGVEDVEAVALRQRERRESPRSSRGSRRPGSPARRRRRRSRRSPAAGSCDTGCVGSSALDRRVTSPTATGRAPQTQRSASAVDGSRRRAAGAARSARPRALARRAAGRPARRRPPSARRRRPPPPTGPPPRPSRVDDRASLGVRGLDVPVGVDDAGVSSKIVLICARELVRRAGSGP